MDLTGTDGSARLLRPLYEPGMLVRHPDEPGWGLGQVQSAVGDRVTVNFDERGKVLIDTSGIELEIVG